MKYKAILVSMPEKWNTFCYIIHTEAPQKVIYLSKKAPGRPEDDVEQGAFGYIEYRAVSKTCTLPYWTTHVEKPKPIPLLTPPPTSE